MQSAAPNFPPANESPSDVRRRARRYRIAAGFILVLGIIGAGVLYWLGSRQLDDSDDPAMIGFNRAADHQMGVLYGKQGQLIEDLDDALKQPGTQAILVVVAAAVVAAVCFFIARILEFESQEADDDDPQQH